MLTRSALPKFFQQLLLHKDINLDLSLEMWLLFILDITDLSWSAVLWDIPLTSTIYPSEKQFFFLN